MDPISYYFLFDTFIFLFIFFIKMCALFQQFWRKFLFGLRALDVAALNLKSNDQTEFITSRTNANNGTKGNCR